MINARSYVQEAIVGNNIEAPRRRLLVNMDGLGTQVPRIQEAHQCHGDDGNLILPTTKRVFCPADI